MPLDAEEQAVAISSVSRILDKYAEQSSEDYNLPPPVAWDVAVGEVLGRPHWNVGLDGTLAGEYPQAASAAYKAAKATLVSFGVEEAILQPPIPIREPSEEDRESVEYEEEML